MAGKILVLGATGTVGKPLVEALLAKGAAVKAASRAGAPVEGAQSAVFDFADPSTFAAAFDGADRAFLMVPTGYANARDILVPVIAAAGARRVKVVMLSALGVDADDTIPYRQAEIALERSGAPFVILRPNWFADNFHSFWKGGVDQGRIAVPAGEGRTSFIDVRDVAQSAAAALTSDAFDGGAFDLTGPEALSYADAARVLSEAIGKPVRYTPVDDAALVTALTAGGVPEPYARFIATLFHPVREGWAAVVTDGVETLTGAKPRSLATYARDHAPALTA